MERNVSSSVSPATVGQSRFPQDGAVPSECPAPWLLPMGTWQKSILRLRLLVSWSLNASLLDYLGLLRKMSDLLKFSWRAAGYTNKIEERLDAVLCRCVQSLSQDRSGEARVSLYASGKAQLSGLPVRLGPSRDQKPPLPQ